METDGFIKKEDMERKLRELMIIRDSAQKALLKSQKESEDLAREIIKLTGAIEILNEILKPKAITEVLR